MKAESLVRDIQGLWEQEPGRNPSQWLLPVRRAVPREARERSGSKARGP